MSEANKSTKVFQAHGDYDMVVQAKYGVKSGELLKEAGVDVDFRMYAGLPHSASPEELEHMQEFLRERLPRIAK